MLSNSRKQKKKPYSPPTLIKLTPEQAKKLVLDRNGCTDEETADLLKLFPNSPHEERQNKQPQGDAADQRRKRSA